MAVHQLVRTKTSITSVVRASIYQRLSCSFLDAIFRMGYGIMTDYTPNEIKIVWFIILTVSWNDFGALDDVVKQGLSYASLILTSYLVYLDIQGLAQESVHATWGMQRMKMTLINVKGETKNVGLQKSTVFVLYDIFALWLLIYLFGVAAKFLMLALDVISSDITPEMSNQIMVTTIAGSLNPFAHGYNTFNNAIVTEEIISSDIVSSIFYSASLSTSIIALLTFLTVVDAILFFFYNTTIKEGLFSVQFVAKYTFEDLQDTTYAYDDDRRKRL